MDVKEYRYFLEVVKQGNISKAAKALFISQPSLSSYLKTLEDRLGVKLYRMVNGKFRLTYEGERFVEYARQIMALDNSMQREFGEIKNRQQGLVKIGVPTTRSSYIIPNLWQQYRKAFPGITVEFYEKTSEKLEEMVFERELDFIFVNKPFRKFQMEYIPLFQEEIVVILSNQNPACALAEEKPGYRYPYISLKNLEKEPVIALTLSQRMRHIADSLYSRAGITPRISYETYNIMTAYTMVLYNLGITFAPDTLCKNQPNAPVSYFSVDQSLTVSDFVVACASIEQLSLAAKALIEETQKMGDAIEIIRT